MTLDSLGTYDATRDAVRGICRSYGRARVLDIGCGDGRLLAALAPDIASGWGIDISTERLREARQATGGHPHLEFRNMPVERLAQEEGEPFDVVLFVGSLEHMQDPLRALAAVRSWIRPGGRVVVAAIAPRAPHAILSRWWLRGSDNPVVQHLGIEGLRVIAQPAGFEVDRIVDLRRGSRRGWAARALQGLLSVYDALGGPTRAVILRPTNDASG